GAAVLAPLHAVVAAAVGDPRLAGRGHHPAHFAALHVGPDRRGGGAGAGDRAAVLLRAVDVEGEILVEVGVVELAGGLVVFRTPGLAAVEADGRAAVIAFDQDLRVVGVDPEDMVVAVGRAQGGELRAAVVGDVDAHVGQVDGVGVLRVREDVHVIEGALGDVHAVVDQAPGFPAVIGAEQPARLALVVGLDQRIHGAGIAGRDRDADAAEDAGRQPAVMGDVLPVRAAVGGLVKAAAGAAAGEAPVAARHLPHGGVDHARVRRIHAERDGAGVVVHEEDLVPGLAAVGGLVDAALGVGGEQMPEGGGIDDVGVLRVHQDPADDVGVAEAHEGPRLAAIGGLVQACAGEHGVARGGIAGADVDDLRVRG